MLYVALQTPERFCRIETCFRMGTYPVGTTQVPTQRQFESITRHHNSHQSHSQRRQGQIQRRITPYCYYNHRRLGQDEDKGLLTSIAVRGNKDKAIMLGGKLMVLQTTDQVILIITIYIMVMKVMGKLTKRTKNHHHHEHHVANSSGQQTVHDIMLTCDF